MHKSKKCAYCKKTIESGKEVKSELLYTRGTQLARKQNDYCSARCVEYDQMAHES